MSESKNEEIIESTAVEIEQPGRIKTFFTKHSRLIKASAFVVAGAAGAVVVMKSLTQPEPDDTEVFVVEFNPEQPLPQEPEEA